MYRGDRQENGGRIELMNAFMVASPAERNGTPGRRTDRKWREAARTAARFLLLPMNT